MPFPEFPYYTGFTLGAEAFHNGFPKAYPGVPHSDAHFTGWHDGWAEAWKATTEGEIKLGVYL